MLLACRKFDLLPNWKNIAKELCVKAFVSKRLCVNNMYDGVQWTYGQVPALGSGAKGSDRSTAQLAYAHTLLSSRRSP